MSSLIVSAPYGAYRPGKPRKRVQDGQPIRARGYVLLRTIRIPRP